MAKQGLFENFNQRSYANTTDPFGSIMEGPKFSYGDAPTVNGDYEEDDKVGRDLEGDPTVSSHDLTPEEEEAARLEAADATIDPEEDHSDLETEADRILAGAAKFDADGGNDYTDAMDFASPLGDIEDSVIDPESTETDEVIEPLPVEAPGTPLEDEHELSSEDILSAPEEASIDEPLETPTADKIALSNISDEELMKELQFRMANKV